MSWVSVISEYLYRTYLCTYYHRWVSTSILMSTISDIRHQHLLFWYRKKICRTENCHPDIGKVPISTSETILISNFQKIVITSAGCESKPLLFTDEVLTSAATVLIYKVLAKQNAISKTRAQYAKRTCAFELFKVHCAATINAKNASF